jgi:hypothetical protein
VSRRRRSLAFGLAALAAAAGAAAVAERYGSTVARGYGPLRPVLVTLHRLPARPIDPQAASADLVVRRVPERFARADALAAPAEAVGLEPSAALAPGAYVSASLLRPPRRRVRRSRGLGRHRSPVELMVSGAGALLAGGVAGAGTRVDVVVSGDPAGGGARVAASSVPLLSLTPGPEGEGPGAGAAATLGLERGEALGLIGAESQGRRITLLPVR